VGSRRRKERKKREKRLIDVWKFAGKSGPVFARRENKRNVRRGRWGTGGKKKKKEKKG